MSGPAAPVARCGRCGHYSTFSAVNRGLCLGCDPHSESDGDPQAKELNFHRACAVKYIVRAGKKQGADEVEDLRKAEFYIRREIRRLEESK